LANTHAQGAGVGSPIIGVGVILKTIKIEKREKREKERIIGQWIPRASCRYLCVETNAMGLAVTGC
jgi:hypothetical protein